MKFLKITLSIIIIFTSLFAKSQQTNAYHNINSVYNDAVDLFKKEKFGAAEVKFQKILDYSGSEITNLKTNSEYFIAICSKELFNNDAEFLLSNFINNHSESSHIVDAYFQMGLLQYRNKKYKKTIDWLTKVNTYNLNNSELAQYYFKLGYSYFQKKDLKKAADNFYEIKSIDNKYKIPALYYYSHIQYKNKNYETALIGFQELSTNVLFAPIVPYYITQIYFYQKKYDKVIEYAPPLLDSASTRRTAEISRIIGESYYKTSRYKQAIPYLEKYKLKSKSITRNDVYELAYAYFRTKNYDKAIKYFINSTTKEDSLSQNAYFHIGYCYAQKKEFKKAMLSYKSAADLDFNKKIQEEALWDYAKLTYQISYSPFDNILNSFTKFAKNYPNSEHIDDAYKYLGEIYLTTKNYQKALNSLENIRKITPDITPIYQRVAFYRGIELYNSLKFDAAIIMFDNSLNNVKTQNNISALSKFWKADSYYRINRYHEAIIYFKDFLLSTGAIQNETEFNMAYYNLGYAYFKLKNYKDALSWFRKFADMQKTDTKSKILADTYNRIGDCFYVNHKFELAIDAYQSSIDINKAKTDYAVYQKSFCNELLKDYNQAIIGFNQIINDYSESSYIDDSYFELGNSYFKIDQVDMAINNFQNIIDNYPQSSYAKKAYLKLGSIYYNQDKPQDAITAYKQVIERFPKTEEADNAFQSLKSIYVDINKVDEYFAYFEKIKGSDQININERDSLTYASVEKLYLTGDCKKSEPLFEKYLSTFPHGYYTINANFYKAECNLKSNELNKALESYNYVISKPKNDFTEFALVKAAKINTELKKYQNALTNYIDLEKIAEFDENKNIAIIGEMQASFKLKNYQSSLNYAKKVLNLDKISDETFQQAHFIIAESSFNQDDYDMATDEYQILSQNTKSEIGAISKYRLIQIYHKQKNDKEAVKQINSFVKSNTNYQKWLAKSFIIWADIYAEQGNLYQAKATLKSIVEGYNNQQDGIIDDAQNKLTEIYEEEAANEQLDEVLDDEINFYNNSDIDLFKNNNENK